jgi:hypothetical protein
MARPIPVVPVTMATLRSNSFIGDCSLHFLLAAISIGCGRIPFPQLTSSRQRKAVTSLLLPLPSGNYRFLQIYAAFERQ